MSHAALFDRGTAERSTSSRGSSTTPTSRRLSAILAADVVGYSRLMGADEERTLHRLQAIRRELFDPKITEHRGRIVKTIGDGMLVEFPSVVDAVRCAVEMQWAMVDRNTDIAEDKRITFRIGVNLGDVIAEGGDIYGDGVNVAARLESLADPGGICISGTVWDHIRDKLSYSFEDMGEQSVKNIARPVHVYAMGANAVASLPLVAALPETSSGRSRSPKPILIAASIVAAVGLGMGVWWVWPYGGSSTAPIQIATAPGPQSSSTPVVVPATGFKTAATSRLSIVVLPFSNLSNDPDQDYFVDAITDDLTTDLSRISDGFVIARNTAFAYKGKAVDAKQVSRDLGVRYVLEGSVRPMGDRAQVNVQLIDGETGAHVWADRFETDRRNLAEAQTEITGRLARTLHLELVSDASRRIEQEHAVDSNARDFVMRGWASWYGPKTQTRLQEAQSAFESALEIDSRSIDAKIGIGLVLAANVGNGLSSSVQADKQRAEQLLVEAIERDPNRSMAHAAMGLLRAVQDRQTEALIEYQTAIALDPNNAWAIVRLGNTLMFMGQPEPCIPYIEKALRLNPRETLAYVTLGKCHLLAGHAVDEALAFFRKGQATNPGIWWIHLKLAGALGLKGEIDEARAEAAEMVKLKPDMNSVAQVRGYVWYRNPQFQILHDKTIIQGLRNAGFPEEVAAQ
jgi:adenylate cyclase